MLSNLFESSTVPMLEQAVCFAQARHTVLAGNIANLDTPGYQVRDLPVEEFHKRLQEAIEARRQPSNVYAPAELRGQQEMSLANVAKNTRSILRHDQDNVGLEYQVTEMVKNQMQHNLALSIMTSQFRLLQTAISERA